LNFCFIFTTTKNHISATVIVSICGAKMRHSKTMDNCERIYDLLRQNRTMQIKKIAKKLKIDDGTVYRHLEHLSLQGKVYYDKGMAFLKETTISKPGSIERYFQWRGSPEGKNVRF